MNTIYIVPIEPIDQRYTKQWYTNIPDSLEQLIAQHSLPFKVVTIYGMTVADRTTSGAFLDFASTNVYKASQAQHISNLFAQGNIKPGDKFLITDAWNFVITPIKYMSDLLDIPVEIHSIWHAGAYDPTDILGMKMAKPWPWLQEQSWFMASDYNYFATEFHRRMFMKNLEINSHMYSNRAVRSGQPHQQIIQELVPHQQTNKKSQVIWPHRYNADKQPEIAEDLGSDFAMVITQKMNLSKADYYQTLGESQIIFSCALHENLGISVMEACLAGVIPVVPDRCSYAEMYLPEFKYPSTWTKDFAAYKKHRKQIVEFIQERLSNPEKYQEALARQRLILEQNYLKADIMFNKILNLTV